VIYITQTKDPFCSEAMSRSMQTDATNGAITVEPSRVLLRPQQSIVVDGAKLLLLLLLFVRDERRPEND